MGENAQNIQLEVSDTGIGVEDLDFPRIFEKFYRIKSDLTKNISGTGLGLSIVKSVVDAHYGTINVESKVGEGTTFTILLPAK
jgi:two-component system phosphate regulon sensor histidine kinase PhoR